MSENFTLSVRGVVDACKKALENQTLGAFHSNTCRYVYPDNVAPGGMVGCAIGVALPADIRKKLASGWMNGSSIGVLISKLNLAKPSEPDMEVLRITQALHDAWASGMSTLALPLTPILAGDMAEPLKAFIKKHNGKRVKEGDFRTWITLLDEVYPA